VSIDTGWLGRNLDVMYRQEFRHGMAVDTSRQRESRCGMSLDTPRLNIPLYMECLLVSTDIYTLRVDSCLNIPLYMECL